MFRDLSLTLLLLSTVTATSAWAQPCCAGVGVFSPTRLKLGEDFLVGAQARVHLITGSSDGLGRYAAAPEGFAEQDFEEDVAATVRLFEDLQLGVLVPFVQTRRVTPGLTESGAGLGDVIASARYELITPGTVAKLPGVAIIGGLITPTGRSVDQSQLPLATDATGLGYFQANVGVDVEHSFGDLLLNGTVGLSHRFARETGGVRSEPGFGVIGSFAVGYAFNASALALDLSFLAEQKSRVNGVVAEDSARLLPNIGLSFGTPLARHLRLRVRLFEDLPAPARNQFSGPGVSALLVRAW